jgi:cytochrome c-type biogenesis protein CcmH
MTGFILGAALLLLLCATLIAVPLLRPGAGEPPARWAALAGIVALTVGGSALYATWTNWSWDAAPEATNAPRTMVAHLARRLEREPNDLPGWLMLGHSYTALQEFPMAIRAYQRADRLAGGKSAEALTGIGEALALDDDKALEGRAGRLFEQALALDPNSGKALFFSAVSAYRRGQLPLARQRFVALLALDPPANVRPALEQQIATIDAQLGGAHAATGASAAQSSAVTGQAAVVRVNVRITPSLAQSMGDAPLFVFVRDPAAPGPPLAVKRLAGTFPQSVELTARDSMVPGRSFAPGQTVQVVARIARSGTPTAQRGDPFGELSYNVGHDGIRELVIDRLSP